MACQSIPMSQSVSVGLVHVFLSGLVCSHLHCQCPSPRGRVPLISMLQESPSPGKAPSSSVLDSPTAAQATMSPICTLLLPNFRPWLHQLSSICSHNLQHQHRCAQSGPPGTSQTMNGHDNKGRLSNCVGLWSQCVCQQRCSRLPSNLDHGKCFSDPSQRCFPRTDSQWARNGVVVSHGYHWDAMCYSSSSLVHPRGQCVTTQHIQFSPSLQRRTDHSTTQWHDSKWY